MVTMRTFFAGMCDHAFHYDCIKKFIERGRPNCPVCNAPWAEKSVVGTQRLSPHS
jgi:hypothetical protein